MGGGGILITGTNNPNKGILSMLCGSVIISQRIDGNRVKFHHPQRRGQCAPSIGPGLPSDSSACNRRAERKSANLSD